MKKACHHHLKIKSFSVQIHIANRFSASLFGNGEFTTIARTSRKIISNGVRPFTTISRGRSKDSKSEFDE